LGDLYDRVCILVYPLFVQNSTWLIIVSVDFQQHQVTFNDEIKKRLDELEKGDAGVQQGGGASDEDDDLSEEEEAVVDDEQEIEENDYLSNYFDNGESYLDDEEDTLDEQDGGVY